MPVISSANKVRCREQDKSRFLTGDSVLDLNTRVDLDEVMPSHLIDQKLCSSSISVSHTLCKLDSIGEDSLADLFRQVGCGRNFDYFLMSSLDGTIALKEMDGVTDSIGENLHFNVSGTFKETLNENSSVTESGLGFRDSSFEGVLKIGLLSDNTHTTSSSSHCSLDNNREAILLDEGISVQVGIHGSRSTWNDRDADLHGWSSKIKNRP